MLKKRLLIALVIFFVLVIASLVLFLFVLKKPISISECEDRECVRRLAASGDFDLTECGKVSAVLRNDCFYYFETENTEVVRENPGKQCSNILGDEDLRAQCFYQTGCRTRFKFGVFRV